MKKHKQQAEPMFSEDASGRRLAHVALSGTNERATLYVEDLERLQAAGWSRYWSLASTGGRFRYVLAYARNPHDRKRSITVARLIAGAGKGTRVTYADGDRLNLRRENLLIVKGGGPAQTPAVALQPRKGAWTADASRDGESPTVETSAPPAEAIEPAAAYTPRVIGRAALSARVKAMQASASNGP